MRYKTKALDTGSGFHRDRPKKSKSPPKKKSPSPEKPTLPKTIEKPVPKPKPKKEIPYIPAPTPLPPQITIAQLRQHIAQAKTDVQGLFADTQELNVRPPDTDPPGREVGQKATQTLGSGSGRTAVTGRQTPETKLGCLGPSS